MEKFKFVVMPCKRCGTNHSMLSKFIFGKEMQGILDVYGKICPSCLTEDEIGVILTAQYDVAINPILNGRAGGGTGCGYGVRVMQDLEKYLRGIE